MVGEQHQDGRSVGFFNRSRQNKVRPFSSGTAESKQIEIRPKRVLRIQHINARPRDPSFEKEMHMQMIYKSQGFQTGSVPGGPLSMPKKKLARESTSMSNEKESTSLPNSVEFKRENDASIREVSASGTKGVFTSPSNVQVDLQGISIPETETVSGSVLDSENKTSEAGISNVNISQNKSTSLPKTEEMDDEEKDDVSEEDDINTAEDNKVSSSLQLATQVVTPRREEPIAKSTPSRSIVDSPRKPSVVLFFIHGVGGSSDVWQTQLRYFAKEGYEIIAPDLIGHGMSCTPQNAKAYHFTESAADMEEMFDRYCKKKNIVIGHSYGCSFAVVLARRRSRRVQKLVLISGGAPTPLAPQPGVFSMPTCMLGCVRPCLNCGFRKKAFNKKRRPVMDKKEAFSIPTYVLQHTMNGQNWPDGDELYHQWLLCPTLLIYGAKDELVKLEEEQHMEEVIFRSRLEVIPDTSHMVMIEAPDEVNRLLLNFFTEDSTLVTKSNTPQVTARTVPPQSPPPPPAQQRERPHSHKSTKAHKAMPSRLA